MCERVYPTEEKRPVVGTAHDFTNPIDLRTLGDEINGHDLQINIGLGYDNYWLLNDECLNGELLAAKRLKESLAVV
jgi:hypothetical protein